MISHDFPMISNPCTSPSACRLGVDGSGEIRERGYICQGALRFGVTRAMARFLYCNSFSYRLSTDNPLKASGNVLGGRGCAPPEHCMRIVSGLLSQTLGLNWLALGSVCSLTHSTLRRGRRIIQTSG